VVCCRCNQRAATPTEQKKSDESDVLEANGETCDDDMDERSQALMDDGERRASETLSSTDTVLAREVYGAGCAGYFNTQD
jgi:hypothetical protein